MASLTMEKIRLVVWDLDDTFWQGILTEGGVAYSQECHDIVVELARRGIMSSICSNNDYAPVAALLRERGIWDYFIFPDLGWGPKGQRIAALIEAGQLRPETVLFLDDNPMNRAEASFYVPGLQTAPESFVAGLLADPRFAGKDDRALTRLQQYKVLEKRQADQQAAGADNRAFLRESGIRLVIDYDIERSLDRAIELINRTNQLNFTKRRLPEEPEAARRELREALSRYDAFAGLVRVSDRYGDYGQVGFFLSYGGRKQLNLQHFCFSCRILNMGIETWVWRWLGRPHLVRIGEVLADPAKDDREIDWIKHDDGVVLTDAGPAATDRRRKPVGRMVLRGGCDISALSHYLADLAEQVYIEHHIVRDGRQTRIDHSAFLRLALDEVSPAARASLIELGYVPEDWTSAIGSASKPGQPAVWILSFWVDAYSMLYRHKEIPQLVVPFSLPGDPHAAQDVIALDDGHVGRFATTDRQRAAVRALKRAWLSCGPSDETFVRSTLRAVAKRAGSDTLICILLGPEAWTDEASGKKRRQPDQARINAWIRAELGSERNVVVLDPLEVAGADERRAELLHFDRLFYQRMAQRIRHVIHDFTARPATRETSRAPDGAGWRRHVSAVLSRLGHR